MRKVISILLAVLMLTGVLAGCDVKNTSSSSTTSSETTQKATTTQKETDPGPAPVIKWYVTGVKAEDHDAAIESLNVDLKAKLNVQLDLQVIPRGEFNDKMKLVTTSGEDYDLVFTANWINSFSENVTREAYLDITSLFDQFGKDILKQIPEYVLDVAKVNGQLLAIPNYQILSRSAGISVQKNLLDKYKVDINSLNNQNNLESFLAQIRDNEKDFFPYRISPTGSGIFSAKIDYERIAGYDAYFKMGDKTLTVIPCTVVEEFASRLDNEWYKKGFLRKDIVTAVDDSADLKAGKYAAREMIYKPGVAAEETAKYGAEYVVLPIVKQYIGATAGIETMTAFNINSKNPEAAMKLLNLIYSDKDAFNKLLFGIEGVHYNKVADNKVEPVEKSKYNYGTSAWMFGNQLNAWFMPGQSDTVWEETDKLNKESEISLLRGFVFNPAPVQTEIAQVAAVREEFKLTVIVATDIDAILQQKNDKMMKAGLDKIVEEVQMQVDAWAKANGMK